VRTLQCEQIFKKKSNNFVTKSIKNYILGLFICIGKKNCNTIASVMGVSYYSVYRSFWDFECRKKDLQDYFINLVHIHATEENPGVFMVDSTQIKKLYSRKSDLLCYDRNGSMKSVLKGISCVVAAWTNGKIVIPLAFDFWVREKDITDDRKYRKKTEISRELIFELKDKIPFAYASLDGDYGNEEFLIFLYKYRLKFSIRMPSNRRIVIDGIDETLKKHPTLKLIRNERYKKAQGYYKGIPVIIIAHKRKGKNNTKQVVFIVSNIQGLSAKEHVEAYACRWPIEKMFRTAKQKFGLENCQCIPDEKHEAHISFVLLAFTEAELNKIANGQKSTEKSIRFIRDQILSKMNSGYDHWKGLFMCF